METVWFILVGMMLAAYIVLDGFDLGAGALHLLIAKNDAERRTILRAIGPVWDGNEVWLVAAGGTLFFAFPLLYAASFSGFYLPLNVVLWLLVLRAVGIEFRMHIDAQVWREFYDAVFALGSALLMIFYGAAFGNVIRGVPLRPDFYFFEPLWTNFQVGSENGILDWYTVVLGFASFAALTLHGALFLVMKTDGALNARARRVAGRLIPVVIAMTAGGLAATVSVRSHLLTNYDAHPVAYAIPLIVAASLTGMFVFTRRGAELNAFLSSCAYLVAMIAGAAVAIYPNLLPASTDPAYSITIYNAASGSYSLGWGLVWWGFGIAVAIGYFVFIYWMFRGKVTAT